MHRFLSLLILAFMLAACAEQRVVIEQAVVPPIAATAMPQPTQTLVTPTLPATITLPPTSTATAVATLTPARTAMPTALPRPEIPRIGIQVGHWQTEQMPDELERFRTSTGTFAAGVSEIEVNLAVSERVVALLEAEGLTVDLLPATIPVKYHADAFVTIHADGASSGNPRGFKVATPWRTSPASQLLMDSIVAEYAAGTGLPQDSAITVNMRGYYAFSWRRHQHAIARTTPAVIVEMGYLSNAQDRAFLVNQPDVIAQSITNGILRYLDQLDRSDATFYEPKEYPVHRAANDGVVVRAAPSANAGSIFVMNGDKRFLPFREVDGWYEGVVRGEWRVIGWVRKDDVVATDEPLTFPTPVGN